MSQVPKIGSKQVFLAINPTPGGVKPYNTTPTAPRFVKPVALSFFALFKIVPLYQAAALCSSIASATSIPATTCTSNLRPGAV